MCARHCQQRRTASVNQVMPQRMDALDSTSRTSSNKGSSSLRMEPRGAVREPARLDVQCTCAVQRQRGRMPGTFKRVTAHCRCMRAAAQHSAAPHLHSRPSTVSRAKTPMMPHRKPSIQSLALSGAAARAIAREMEQERLGVVHREGVAGAGGGC